MEVSEALSHVPNGSDNDNDGKSERETDSYLLLFCNFVRARKTVQNQQKSIKVKHIRIKTKLSGFFVLFVFVFCLLVCVFLSQLFFSIGLWYFLIIISIF